MRGLLTALAFLTRLAPARLYRSEELAAALAWMPAVGLLLGGLLALPLALGLLTSMPWVQAWLFLLGSLWATRGLHLDGLADVADAWGSNSQGQRFWEIIKDSRLGAFGATALMMALSGQLVLLHELFDRQAYKAAVLALVAGRLAAVVLAWSGKPLARPGLGQLFISGATPRGLTLSCTISISAGLLLVRPVAMLAMFTAALLPVLMLRSLAQRQGGLNGDFLGAAIVLGEAAACLGWLVAV